MSGTEKTHALYEEFVRGFLHPLFTGGTAQQTRALPPALLDHFAHARPAEQDIEDAILRSMNDIAASLAPIDSVPFPDHGAAAVAMAGHNLAMLTDPALDRTFARGAMPKVLAWTDALIEAIDVPESRGAALARHAVLERMLGTRREDTVVKNWAYTYRFYGRPPPSNVVAMPKLRFVRQQTSTRDLVALIEEEAEVDLRTRLRRLLSRSPVSELLRTDLTRVGESHDLQFGFASLAVLSDGALRYGIVQQLVKDGTQHVAAPLGHALRVLSALGAPSEYLYVALAFLVELQLLEVLDARAGHEPKSEPAVGDEELFAAVLPALFHHKGPLRSMLTLTEVDLARVRKRAELRRVQAGADAVELACAILDRAKPPSAVPNEAQLRYPTAS